MVGALAQSFTAHYQWFRPTAHIEVNINFGSSFWYRGSWEGIMCLLYFMYFYVYDLFRVFFCACSISYVYLLHRVVNINFGSCFWYRGVLE